MTFIDETKELASLYDDSVLEYEPAGPIAGASLPVHTAPSNLAISPLAAQASDGRDETTSGDTWSTVDTDSVREQLRSPRDVVPVLSPSYSSISYNPPLVVDSPIRPSSITHSIVSLPHQPRSHSTPTFPLTGNSPSVRAYNAATSPHDHPTPSLEPSSFPLSDVQEAKLVYHFVTKLACFFDMCDQDNRHFELVVPQRAAACPTLRNAIFAASAKHLSRTSGFDPVVADRYHQESLKYLIPALNDSTAVMNEDLLAATIILRFLEEVEGACLGEDVESHLLGTHAFIGAQNSSGINGGLREACFWVALRQENRMAFVHQRCVSSAFHHYNLDLSMSPASDSVWANRIVMHASNTLRYCFGDGDKNIATYHELVAYSEQWMECKPQSFTPLYYKEAEPDGDIFPSVWYLNDAVVNGMQYYYLIDIVLAAYNPEIPSLGPRRKPMLQHVNVSIQELYSIFHSDVNEKKKKILTACRRGSEMMSRWFAG